MAIDVSQLTIKVVSDGIDKAANSLNRLAEASAKVESSTMVVKTTTDAANTSTSNAAKATTSYIDRLQAKVDLLGKNNAQAAAYTATQKGLADGEIRLAESLGSKLDAWKAMAKVQEEAIAMNKVFTESEDATSKRLRQVAVDASARVEAQNALIASQRAAGAEVAKAVGYSEDLVKAQNAQMASAVKVVDVNNSVSAAFANSRKAAKQQVETMGEVIASISPAEKRLQDLALAEERLYAAFQKTSKGAGAMKELAEGEALIAAQRVAFVEKQAKAVAKATEDASKGAAGLLTNAGAMREFFVILREGARGDFSRMAGSISILVDRLGVMGIALAVLTSPITWFLGALGVVGVLAIQGADEVSKFNQALILTGNYAGKTAGQMENAAAGMKEIAGQHAAAQALTEVANTGRFAGDQVVMIGKAALQMKEMTGQSIEATIKQFENLGKSPAEAVYKLDEQYHFLTADVYEQIRALDEQGKHQEAAELAVKTYADTISNRTPQVLDNLGLFERAWLKIKQATNEALDAGRGIGRQKSLEEEKQILENTLATKRLRDPSAFGQSDADVRKDVQAKLEVVNEAIRMANRASADTADNTRIQSLGKEALKQADDHLEKMKGEIRLQKEINEITERYINLRKAEQNAPSKAYEAKLAGVKFDADGNPVSGGLFDAEVADAKKRSLRAAPRGNDYGINKQIQDNKNAIQDLVDNTKMGMSQVKAQYDRGEIDTEAYLQKDYLLKAGAYAKEYALAEKNLEIAKQKKNVEAISLANKEIQKLQNGAVKDAQDYTESISTLDKKRQDNVQKLTESLVATYKARQEEIDNAINGAGLGASAQDALARQLQATRAFNTEMKRLDAELLKGEQHGGINKTTYEQETAVLKDNLDKRIAQEKQYTADKLRVQGDWVNGASKAFQDYQDNANNVAAQTQNAFTDAFKGLEDVLTTFIRTGKLSFGSLVDSILADMARMEAKKFISSLMGGGSGGAGIFGSLFSMGLGLLGGGAGNLAAGSDGAIISDAVGGAGGILGGQFANGGDPPLNVPSLVGENGPELFVPKQAGTVVPNGQLGGSSTNVTYAPTIHIDSRADRAQVMQDVQNAVKAGNAKLVDDLRRRRMI